VRVPVVVTFHGSDLLVNPTKHISRLLAPTAAKVIVVSERLRHVLGYGEVIPCGIPVKNFVLPAVRGSRSCSRAPSTLRLLFPSDPARKIKDYGLFRAVVGELRKRGIKVEEIHLVDIERRNVPRVYWESDVLVLTSRSEASPTVIKEAIAAKLPFVSVDVGDVEKWAGLVDFGIVVSDRDPRTMADAIVRLLAKVGDRSMLDNKRCLDALDVSAAARRVRAVYDEVLSGQVSETREVGRTRNLC